VIVAAPGPTTVTVAPVITATPESDETSETGNPEEAVATSSKEGAPTCRGSISAKRMVWLPLATTTVLVIVNPLTWLAESVGVKVPTSVFVPALSTAPLVGW